MEAAKRLLGVVLLAGTLVLAVALTYLLGLYGWAVVSTADVLNRLFNSGAVALLAVVTGTTGVALVSGNPIRGSGLRPWVLGAAVVAVLAGLFLVLSHFLQTPESKYSRCMRDAGVPAYSEATIRQVGHGPDVLTINVPSPEAGTAEFEALSATCHSNAGGDEALLIVNR